MSAKNKMPKIIMVAGARPNFMKIAPLGRDLSRHNVSYALVHTGQHYDDNMSAVFFKEFGLKKPDWRMNAGSSSHAVQTANIMEGFEKICNIEKPDIVIVVGDVNSTMACAIVAAKMGNIKLAHVEAGARSFDRSMPEEVNRVVTDVISDYLFVIEPTHMVNLINEGVSTDKIFLVGDTMVDNILYYQDKLSLYSDLMPYILVTLHRVSNVDDRDNLENILKALDELSKEIRVVFTIHPRTRKRINEFGYEGYLKNLKCLPPLSYFEFSSYLKGSVTLLTDSGGAQIESAVLGIPCITMREVTERMLTIEGGTNTLVGADKDKIIQISLKYVRHPSKVVLTNINKRLIDGKASERIINILLSGG